MPRLGIGDLSKAPKRFRPSCVLLKGKVKHPFETKEEAEKEARKRAKLLRKSADQYPDLIDAQEARDLANRLEAKR